MKNNYDQGCVVLSIDIDENLDDSIDDYLSYYN